MSLLPGTIHSASWSLCRAVTHRQSKVGALLCPYKGNATGRKAEMAGTAKAGSRLRRIINQRRLALRVGLLGSPR